MASGQPDYCCWDLRWYCTFTDFWHLPRSKPGQRCQSCQSQLVTGGVKCGSRTPQAPPGQHSTQSIPSSCGRRAKNSVYFATKLSSTYILTLAYVQTQRVYLPVYHLKGEKKISHTNQAVKHFVYHSAGIFLKYTEDDSPAYFRVSLFICFLRFFFSLDKCIYGAQLHKDSCQLGDWKPWMR